MRPSIALHRVKAISSLVKAGCGYAQTAACSGAIAAGAAAAMAG